MRESTLRPVYSVLALLCILAALGVWTGCRGGRTTGGYVVYTGGNANQGKQLIENYRCGSCHTIPGVPDAMGKVGPPLEFFARRTYVGGEVPNTPQYLIQWIQDPKSIEPGTAMPDLGVSEAQARDIAAYLYTLR